jgi:hypothetical protein
MKKFIVLFVLAFLLMGCSGGEVKSTTTSTKDTTADVAGNAPVEKQGVVESTFSTLKDAMAAGLPMECTWSYSDGKDNIEGSVIVSGGKFKSDAHYSGQGGDFDSHSISDGTYMYVWSSMPGSKGMKMLLPDEEEYEQPEEGSAQYVDLEAAYNYRCAPTVAGPGTFSPPNMEFVDMTAMMQDMQAMSDKYQDGEEVDMEQLQADMEAMNAQYQK